MEKIPTLYVRDPDNRKIVTDVVTPGCEWVLAGEGVPTRKYDGTCVMFDGYQWWARREVKPGKTPPENWVHVTTDKQTGKSMGWEPVEQSAFAKFHAEATGGSSVGWLPGTYELVGPKIQGNPEGQEKHALIAHKEALPLNDTGRTYGDIVAQIRTVGEQGIEGIVWHHPDGRMAKLKVKDMP
jgi:hypothetical protein